MLEWAIYTYAYGHFAQAAAGQEPPEPVDINDALKATVIALTLIGAVLTGLHAYRKQLLAEGDAQRADASQFAERYTVAAGQLGHDQSAVRLAGVHALTRLADDWEEQRQVCVDVLCAYLRMPYESDPTARGYKQGEREVRQTIVGVIRDHLQDPGSPDAWCTYRLDFTGAVFDGGDFSSSRFQGGVSFKQAAFVDGGVSFRKARFSSGLVDFRGATFNGGTVTFVGAVFCGDEISFGRATFRGSTATFDHAIFDVDRVSFGDAIFDGATVTFNHMKVRGGRLTFGNARFDGSRVTFDCARLGDGGITFIGAKFIRGGIGFFRTDFRGGTVTFDRATFMNSSVSFDRARLGGGTVTFDRTRFRGVLMDWGPLPVPAGA
ncbi:pentapeptide repeat-containing protein [Streptomyces populi]